jgi:hypothetical protein
MDLESPKNIVLFILGLASMVASVAIRRVFLSLFFAFVYTLFVSCIFLSIGQPVLAATSFLISAGINYTLLTTTSLLIGSHNSQKPKRRLSISRGLFIVIVISLAVVFGLIIGDTAELPRFSNVVTLAPKEWTASAEFTLVCIILALTCLTSLLCALLLIRYDDVIDSRGDGT